MNVTLDNYELDRPNEDNDERRDLHHNWVNEVVRCEGRAGVGIEMTSSCTIIRPRPEKKDLSTLTRLKHLLRYAIL